MLGNVYYRLDDQALFLHLDGCLRQIPDADAFQTLFGFAFDPSDAHQFANASLAPYSTGHPLPAGISLHTLPGNATTVYMTDVFPWNEQQTVLRPIVNRTQWMRLGFRSQPRVWSSEPAPPVCVPLAIDTGHNWHLQTFIAGYHLYYNHLCHPENPMNAYFASWLGNRFSKAELKRRIIQTQTAIDQLKGEVPVAQPKLVPDGGDLPSPQVRVEIECATRGATIYYTIDGTDPVPGVSTVYSGPVTLDLAGATASIVLEAVAEYHDSLGTSPVASADFTYDPIEIATPTFAPAQGPRAEPQVDVSILCDTQGCTIRYTIDGTTPDAMSPAYQEPVRLDLSSSAQTVKAIALHDTYGGSSGVASATYRYVPRQLLTPVFAPLQDSYVSPSVAVAIRSDDPGAVLRYSTDATQPPGTLYTVPVALELAAAPQQQVTLSAQATSTYGPAPSEIARRTYRCSRAWKHVWELEDSGDDLVGNANLVATDVGYETGKRGDAASFVGTSILTTTDVQNLQSAVFTIAIWAQLGEIPRNGLAAIWGYEAIDSGNNGPALLVTEGGGLQAQTCQQNGVYVKCLMSPGSVQLNLWTQYVVVADGKLLSLYANGAQRASQPYDGTLDSSRCTRFNVGAERAPGSGGAPRHGLIGLLDRLYYIDAALTSDEVASLYREELL